MLAFRILTSLCESSVNSPILIGLSRSRAVELQASRYEVVYCFVIEMPAHFLERSLLNPSQFWNVNL